MTTKAKSSILPRNPKDPTGIDRLERGAINDFGRRMRKVRRAYIDALARIPADPITTNRKDVEAKRYTYRLDQHLLQSIMSGLNTDLSAILLEGGENHLWFFDAYVSVAAVRGTAQEFANLAQQSEVYKAGRGSVSQILASDPYRRRMAIVRSRLFEDMENLTLGARSAMSRVLTDGIGRGLNPRDIAKNLTKQAGIEEGRARRIARTEVPMALRRARWDESDDAAEAYGLRTMELHLSALSPTTRASHAARHGKLFTREQVRDWYAVDGNGINCYLPGTQVSGRFVAGSKAQYRGPVVEIVTASGRNLTVTPNHPVMTTFGLIPANEVVEGNDLLAYSINVEDAPRVSALNNEHGDARVENVFSALVQRGHVRSRRVDAVDFHGDGRFMEEDVDVVSIDGILTFGCDTHLSQALDYINLEHAHAVGATVFCSPAHSFIAVGASAPGGLSGNSAIPSKLSGQALGTENCGVGRASLLKTVGVEISDDGDSRPPNRGTQLLNRLASHVPVEQFLGRELIGDETSIAGKASRSRPALNSVATHAVLFGDGSSLNARGIFLDNVLHVVRREYFGHVYDLQELSGLMCANGIIASNCKCSQTAVMVDADGKPLVPSIVDRAKQTKKVMEKRDYDWSK